VDWSDAEDIGMALFDAHPGIDPLTVRFTQLREWILQFPDFEGDPASSSEGKLEAIQMAWYEEWQEAQRT
jgi:FeS assembly protein IscX